MKWLRNITRSGLQHEDAYQDRRGVLLSNYISLTLCGCILLMFILRRFIFGHIPGGIDVESVIIGFAASLAPILFNRAGLTTTGRLLLCYTPVLYIWYVYLWQMRDMVFVEQSAYDSERIHLLAMSFVPYVVLDKKKPWLLVAGILPTLISLLFFDFILSQFGYGILQRGFRDEQYILVGSRTLVAYCIISMSCFLFQSIITYNDDLNRVILSELKSKSELIKNQNEELIQSQEHLNDVNLHLEDLVLKKTISIRKQNELLLKYAYSNAHHVRGPIARVLGLIQISRLESNLDYPWLLDKVEEEARSADKIISGIASELSGTEPHE